MKAGVCGVIATLFWMLCAAMGPTEKTVASDVKQYFLAGGNEFSTSLDGLKNAIQKISSLQDTPALKEAVKALRLARLRYKRIEPLMEYFFRYPVNLYNRPPVYEVEEPYMEYQEPVGMQVVEALLMNGDAYNHKTALLEQCEVLRASAADLPAILFNFTPMDGELMEALRLEVIRIATLGITGYDAPQLKSGIEESAVALDAVRMLCKPLLQRTPGGAADSVLADFDAAFSLLRVDADFDRFDRLRFWKDAVLPLQMHLRDFARTAHLTYWTGEVVDGDVPHLFSAGALQQPYAAPDASPAQEAALANLGRQLFSEPILSGNGKRSCATCHRPDRYFTDGRAKSPSLDEHSPLDRNTPTLLYAGYQHAQFLDGRVRTLEEQVLAVLRSPREMGTDTAVLVQRLTVARYDSLFKTAFPLEPAGRVTPAGVAAALAAFERSLAPFNAPLDSYLRGEKRAMSAAQIRGFNLFNGKAQCGTCHFAPVFNGLLPPQYAVSELEVLGAPANGRLRRSRADKDSGRYHFFPIGYYIGAFKTPTVRNAARTGPYMHNGRFKTLTDIVEFYNRGGGQGLGLDVPGQTLSAIPLELSKRDVADVVAFIHALTDVDHVTDTAP